jgi:hypothetical protein
MCGYAVQALDAFIGRLEDVLVDDQGWWVADIVVQTRGLLPGSRYRVPRGAVASIDPVSRSVRLRLTRDHVSRLPQHPALAPEV